MSKAQEKRFVLQSAIDTCCSGVLMVDMRAAGRPLCYANAAFTRLSGYTGDEVRGLSCQSITLDESQALAWLRTALADYRCGRSERSARHKDGSTFHAELRISEVADAAGCLTHLLVSVDDVSESHAAWQRLIQQEEWLRLSLERGQIGSWAWNLSTGETVWSERVSALLGYAPGALQPSFESFVNAVHPQDRDHVMQALNASIEFGQPYDIVHRCVWPDRTVHWLQGRGGVMRTAHGAPARLLGLVQDVTDQKQREIAAAERQARLEEAQHLARVGYWERDMASGQTYWSQTLTDLVGRGAARMRTGSIGARATLQSEPPLQFDPAMRQQPGAKLIDRVHQVVLPSGEVGHVQERIRVVPGPSGLPRHMLGIMQDVSALVRAEERLALLEQVFQFVEQSVGVADLEGRMLYANGAFERALGYTPQEIRHKLILDFVAPSAHANWLARTRPDASGEQHWRGQLALVRKNGALLMPWCHVGTLGCRSGAPQFVFTIFSNADGSSAAKVDPPAPPPSNVLAESTPWLRPLDFRPAGAGAPT